MKHRIILWLLTAALLTGCSNAPVTEPEEGTIGITPETNTETTAAPTTQSTTETTETESITVDTLSVYADYFGEHYYEDDLVCLRDVTHDGVDDMIVIYTEDGISYYGLVYTLQNGNVKKIYEKSGGTDHAGGYFNWYLVQDGQSWDLAEEYFEMWQGQGETGFRIYSLSDSGEQYIVNQIYTPKDADDCDSSGKVKADVFDEYVGDLSSVLSASYRLYSCYSESSVHPNKLETDPAMVFGRIFQMRKSATEPVPDREDISLTAYTIQGCNLRSTPSKDNDDNIIGFLPAGTEVKADQLVDEYWYHVTCSAGSGYISHKMLKIGSASEGDTQSVSELERIAEQMYQDNALAVVSCYTYMGWETDYADTISDGEYITYYSIKGIHSKQEALAFIHKTFSKRYDDYNRVQTSGDPREMVTVSNSLSGEREFVLFKEKNQKLYVFQGDCPYNLGSVTAKYQYTDGDEVWFHMTANEWSTGPFAADFSLLKEDGVWKIGAATYPRY